MESAYQKSNAPKIANPCLLSIAYCQLTYPQCSQNEKKGIPPLGGQGAKECLPFIAVPISTVKKAGIRNCHTALTNNV